MAGVFEDQKTGKRVLFGVVIAFIALSMLLYLVPVGSQLVRDEHRILIETAIYAPFAVLALMKKITKEMYAVARAGR